MSSDLLQIGCIQAVRNVENLDGTVLDNKGAPTLDKMIQLKINFLK